MASTSNSNGYDVVKRVADAVISTALIGLLSPLLLAIALVIAAESGWPVLFRQERIRLHGVPFKMLKFRTMVRGSEGSMDLNADGSLRTSQADPRITRTGAFLRRHSLDELPQLINVFRGEMSLVGPRPDLPFQRQCYTVAEARKLSVRPGMTGLAQVSGRNGLGWKERLRYDLEYVSHRSMRLDLAILCRTLLLVLRMEDVYQAMDDRPSSVWRSNQK